MNAIETDPADLGALIETYRPVGPLTRQDVVSFFKSLFSCYMLIVVGFGLLLGYSFLVIRKPIEAWPQWLAGTLFGATFTMGLLLVSGIFTAIHRRQVNQRGFRVEIYEKGFWIHTAKTYPPIFWENLKQITSYATYTVICQSGQPQIEITSDELWWLRDFGKRLENQWQAATSDSCQKPT